MGKPLTVDYYAERDVLYLRAEPLPRYRVREPADCFLVYVAREPKNEIVGFEILDFGGYPLDEFRDSLRDYLNLHFDVPELNLTDVTLSDILAALRVHLRSQPVTPTPTT
jgi:hypothetical protein